MLTPHSLQICNHIHHNISGHAFSLLHLMEDVGTETPTPNPEPNEHFLRYFYRLGPHVEEFCTLHVKFLSISDSLHRDMPKYAHKSIVNVYLSKCVCPWNDHWSV